MDYRTRIHDFIQQAGSLETGQTNTLYYVLWEFDGSVAAQSPGAPDQVPAPNPFQPERTNPQRGPGGFGPGPGPGPQAQMAPIDRTRGEFREMLRYLPNGAWLLVGRSMAPDLAAMRRLTISLIAAGGGVLLFGLVGGWWVASRAIRPIEAISATAIKIAGGDLSQRINAANTDNELGRLAALLNSTFARLEAAFAHQARFTSDASHELRTPVSVILAQTQMALSRQRPASDYRESLEACQRAAQRMRKLTESLLALARLDAGQEPMKNEPFDLSRVARECVELVRPLAVERGLDVHCELPAVPCLGDAERIGQVATNLLTNAIQYTRNGGKIQISTAAQNGSAVLTVTDTGTGIPPEDLPHIFERFYRADKSRSRLQGHSGLGLAICKAIVDAHGGTIDVSSQPGAGSSFVVKLPVG
jgi:heavy metal sensor kinase